MEDSRNVTVEEGEDLHLSVRYTYWLASVQWILTGKFFDVQNWTMSYQGNSYRSVLSLKNVSIKDQGEYKVLAKDIADQTVQNNILVSVRLIGETD